MRGRKEETERALVERAQAGDREAFGLLARLYLVPVHRVAYRLVRNQDEAADIAQDAFVRAYRGIARFDPSRPLFPWLCRITQNLALNRLGRDRKRDAGCAPDLLPADLLPADALTARDAGPEALLIATDEANRVRCAVASLPERHRVMIELSHFQECSYKEIADMLGIPIGTVMSRLYHARQQLRKALDEGAS